MSTETTTSDPTTEKIRKLNDELRVTMDKAKGRVCVTASVAALSFDDQAAILREVRAFKDFNEDNDPYGEHDFGNFEHAGKNIFWKIDYYDKDLQYVHLKALKHEKGSEDPSDANSTTRVLTVMLAADY